MARLKNVPALGLTGQHWALQPAIDWDKVEVLARVTIDSPYQRQIHDSLQRLGAWLTNLERKKPTMTGAKLKKLVDQLGELGDVVSFGIEAELERVKTHLTVWADRGEGQADWDREVVCIMKALESAGMTINTTQPTANSKSIPAMRAVLDYLLRYGVRAFATSVPVRGQSEWKSKPDGLARLHLGSDKALARAMQRAWRDRDQE
jgi:hypothetical protein